MWYQVLTAVVSEDHMTVSYDVDGSSRKNAFSYFTNVENRQSIFPLLKRMAVEFIQIHADGFIRLRKGKEFIVL